jgi:6-pyruvoyltetrahydropterin/6-carboxytetrahydropterin synthase
MTLTRVYRFSASHRLHSDHLPADRNAELYGKCNNPHGHGHNYVLEVTVHGEIDPGTGRVISPGELDRFIGDVILRDFDHRDMNHEIPEFKSLVPTTENLASVIDGRIRRAWPFRGWIDRVFIRETPRNAFELRRK